MILSNVEIHKALDDGRLEINPDPQPRFPSEKADCPYDTHSVELHLGANVSIPDQGTFVYDLTQEGSIAQFISKNSEQRSIPPEGFTLERNRFLLGTTIERIGLPILSDSSVCLAARVEGKSSRARCGILVHFTAPTVHPGWSGPLTLEIINLGPAPFMLRPGMAIAQLIIEEVKGIPFGNESQFQRQSTPEGLPGPKT